jgi:hypothetical protein
MPISFSDSLCFYARLLQQYFVSPKHLFQRCFVILYTSFSVILVGSLLGQFGKSKWQLYFELLRLPMEIQGLKPSVLMKKLKQHLLLQPLPWKFLATRFRWQEWPPWPIMPLKLNSPPHDIKQLQRFLGMVNFYRRFLANCTKVLRPLTDLLKGWAKPLEWIASAQEALQNAKGLLAVAVPLLHPPQMLSFTLLLTPPIPISKGSCNKILETKRKLSLNVYTEFCVISVVSTAEHLDSYRDKTRSV